MYPRRSRSISEDLPAEGPEYSTTLPPLRLNNPQSPHHLVRPPALEPPSGPSNAPSAPWLASSSPSHRQHHAALSSHQSHLSQEQAPVLASLPSWSPEESNYRPSSSGTQHSSKSVYGQSPHSSPQLDLSASASKSIAQQDVAASFVPPVQSHGLKASSFITQPCSIRLRQQPEVARACGFGERDRRVIDPPPILELDLSPEELAQGEDDGSDVQLPVYVIHTSLWSEDGAEDLTTFEQPPKKSARRLVGTLVASGTIARDENSRKGCFFTFADLSCRTNGRYRLRFNLVKIDPANMRMGVAAPLLANLMSDVFTVYSPKDFPGMRRSTPLTQALKNQGVSVPAKKSKLSGAGAGGSSSHGMTPNDDD